MTLHRGYVVTIIICNMQFSIALAGTVGLGFVHCIYPLNRFCGSVNIEPYSYTTKECSYMVHHTKDKGDFATIKTIFDLTQKGFVVFTPLICEHLPFDIAGYKDGKFIRFQSKYRDTGIVSSKTVWSDKNGLHIHKYSNTDFDYYSIYLPDKDVVCYPSIKFAGCKLVTKLPNSATPFYWYEDFLNLTDTASKKNYRDFGYELTRPSSPREKYRKVLRPSKEELEQLLWQLPMSTLKSRFGVSDKAIAKWAKSYGITLPARGYWITKNKTSTP